MFERPAWGIYNRRFRPGIQPARVNKEYTMKVRIHGVCLAACASLAMLASLVFADVPPPQPASRGKRQKLPDPTTLPAATQPASVGDKKFPSPAELMQGWKKQQAEQD